MRERGERDRETGRVREREKGRERGREKERGRERGRARIRQSRHYLFVCAVTKCGRNTL